MPITQREVWVPSSGSLTTTMVLTPQPGRGATLDGSTLLLTAVCRDNTSTIPVISDPAGNTWVHAATYRDAGQSTVHHVFIALNAAAISSVTSTVYAADGVNAPATTHTATLQEFRGVLDVADIKVGLSANAPTGSVVSAPPVTTTMPESLVFVSTASGVTNRTLVAGEGWTELHLASMGNMRNWRSWDVVETAGEVTATWTLTAGQPSSFSHIVVAFTPDPNAGGPLTVDVGADQTVGAENNLPLAATVSGGSGARTYAWTIQSGPAGDAQFVGAANQSTTFDPSGNPGVYVLRCTVTDSTGSAHDELTVTVLRTLAHQPFATLTDTTGWTVTGAANAAAALSDSDDGSYVTSQDDPAGQLLGGTLPPLAIPDQPVVIRGMVRAPAATTGTVVAQLYTGATLRATSTEVPVTVGEDTFAQVDVVFPLSALTAITETAWQSGVRATLAFTAS